MVYDFLSLAEILDTIEPLEASGFIFVRRNWQNLKHLLHITPAEVLLKTHFTRQFVVPNAAIYLTVDHLRP